MTPQELELSKIKKLEELSKPSVYKGKPVASFTVEKYID
jgi:hypothetical protein